jgi:ribosomal protein S18 acetylase RimI-like enzyme
MAQAATDVRIRALNELDIGAIVKIDEKVTGRYRPEEWETRIAYYIRRDPEASLVAEVNGTVVGFMLGEVRSGEFGLEEPTGWIEVLGVDPTQQGKDIGRRLAETMLEHFRTRGARVVRTLVDEGLTHWEQISRFFRALGFEPARVHPFIKRL